MANLSGFDASAISPAESFDVIPAGTYTGMITDSEMKSTKAGTGEYLQIVITVIDGEFENRKLWDRLNLINDNSTAVEIAQQTLSAICHAVGVLQPGDSSELHDIPLVVKVGVEKSNTGDLRNIIKGYAKVGAPAAHAKPAAIKPASPAAPAAHAKPAAPWATKKATA